MNNHQKTNKSRMPENKVMRLGQRLCAMCEATSDGIVFTDLKGNIIDANSSATRMSGWGKEKLSGMSIFDLITQKEQKKAEEHMRKVLQEGYTGIEEYTILDRKGEKLTVEVSVSLLKDKQGEPGELGIIVRDVTPRRMLEKKLSKSRREYRAMFENTGTAMIVIEEDTTISLANRGFEKLSGYQKEQIEGKKSWTEFVAKKDLEKMQEYHRLRRADKDAAPKKYEFSFTDRQGHIKDVFITIDMIPGTKKSVASLLDVTERKKKDEKIKKLYSLQQAMRSINQILLKARDKKGFFQEVCNVLGKLKGFDFVWIGTVEPETFSVKPVACAGDKADSVYFTNLTLDGSEYQKGPIGIAVERKKPFGVKDIRSGSRYGSWGKEALRRGYKSGITVPLVHGSELFGVLTIYFKKKDGFGPEEVTFLEEIAGDIAIGMSKLTLAENLKRTVNQLEKTTDSIIRTLARTTEIRDPYTADHQRRVTQLAVSIAKQMGLAEKNIRGLYTASSIHDIGKIHIPAEILSKPSKLTQAELSIIRSHSEYGHKMLKDVEFTRPIAQIVLQHHERLDGSGYPQGLKGDSILLEAKILAVADVVEAMSSHRPYRPALGIEKAVEEIEKNKGSLYDAQVADTCLRLLRGNRFKFQ